MKKITALLMIFFFTALLPLTVWASEKPELSAAVTDAVRKNGVKSFVLTISIEEADAPYSALDFSVISNDHKALYILDKSKDPEEKLYEISFLDGFGNAYHKGRVEESTGEIDYLVGVFSQSPENKMKKETELCNITFIYEGTEPQEVSLTNLQLVYFDEDGVVRNEVINTSTSLTITDDMFKFTVSLKVILLIAGLAAVGILIFALCRRRSKPGAPTAPDTQSQPGADS